MTDASPCTEKMIFGSDTGSDVELCDDSNVQDRDSAASAVCAGKKRAVPEKKLKEHDFCLKNGSNEVFLRESRNDIS